MKKLIKGNVALAISAINSGCRGYFGYPITPQNEIIEYMSEHMPSEGACIQAESELASINMVFAASAVGARAMTSSSGPGIALMQEGISAIASAELPAVIVSVSRNGSGGGSIQPGQGDYFNAVKGGGNGDYRTIVFAPNSVQEMYDLTAIAFNVADIYRNPVMILVDGAVAQMSEVCELREPFIENVNKDWALKGFGYNEGEPGRDVITWHWSSEDSRNFQFKLAEKYKEVAENETRSECYLVGDADVVIVAFGIISRLAKVAIDRLREKGLKVGLLRPITLYPFPEKDLRMLNEHQHIVVIEQNNGQMVEDVERYCRKMSNEITFIGGGGGILPTTEELVEKIKNILIKEVS